MTRRRSSASGRFRPAPRRSLLGLWLLVATVVAACIGDLESPTPTLPTDAPTPTATAAPDPTDTPRPTDTPVPSSAEPTATPVETADPTASTSVEPGDVSACTGNDDNRRFYAGLAEAVDWDVYCAVLPDGWSVTSGEYQLAGGGWLAIDYRGPGGATLALRQGTDCQAPDDCVPTGPDAGDSAFGDRDGVLVIGEDGRYAVVADRGAAVSWVAIGSDMDVEDLQAYAAALSRVD